jgi:hypothetical protein
MCRRQRRKRRARVIRSTIVDMCAVRSNNGRQREAGSRNQRQGK